MDKDELVGQIFEQISILQKISSRQLELARQARNDGILSDEFYLLMDEREEIRKTIDKLKDQLTPSVSLMELLDPEKAVIMRETIEGIEAHDQETRSAIGAILNDLKNRIQSTRANQKALAAYSPPSLDNPWFFDKKK